MILGDLFDTTAIPLTDLLETYRILRTWCIDNPTKHLYLVPGNHDLPKTSNVLSSFKLLAQLLHMSATNVTTMDEADMTPYGYVIPHVANQDLFNLELGKVPECTTLFLHCNFDNGFAAQSDQSLNLSRQQVQMLPAGRIILGHEHNPTTSGKVLIPGNQTASSIADWQQGSDKTYIKVAPNGDITWHVSAKRSDLYAEMPITDLQVTDHKFVKVTGEVAGVDASKMITALNKFRQRHPAFVVANAVTIKDEGEDGVAQVVESLAAAQGFDIWSILKDMFTEKQIAKLTSIGENSVK